MLKTGYLRAQAEEGSHSMLTDAFETKQLRALQKLGEYWLGDYMLAIYSVSNDDLILVDGLKGLKISSVYR